MATIYYDFNASTNGDGTTGTTPKNTWATPSNGDVIKIKRGCTWTRTTQLSLAAITGLTFTTYYNSDGSDDISFPKPIITHTAPNTFAWNFQGDGLHLIENLQFRNCTTNTNGGVIGGGLVAATSVGAKLHIKNCDFINISHNAIRDAETGASASPYVKIEGCVFDYIGEDCFYGGSLYFEFSRNKVTNVSMFTETGDGVGILGVNPTLAWIHHNYIDHSSRPFKHCVIIDANITHSGFAIIEDNTLIGPIEYGVNNTTIVNGDARLIIRRNLIKSGRVAVNLAGNNSELYNNVIEILEADINAPVIAVDADNCLIYNNTIVCRKQLPPATKTLVQASGATSNTIRNNIFYNVPIAVWSDDATNPTVSNNAFWQVTTNYENVSSGVFTGTNDVITDPILPISLIPKNVSPLVESGVFVANTKTFNGFRHNPPSIGAYEYVVERGVR